MNSTASGRPRRRRDGCSECKRKKARCDLKKPVCSRCTRYPKECKYEPNFIVISTTSIQPPGKPQAPTPQHGTQHRSPQAALTHTDPCSPRLPQQLALNSSPALTTPSSRLLIHHFGTQTAPVLFPLAPPAFKQRLVATALSSSSSSSSSAPLLHALLAAAASHRARLLRDASPATARAVLALSTRAVAGLRAAVADPASLRRADTAMAAMALCTNDVCDGHLRRWRVHLAGVRGLLDVFVRGGGRADPLAGFLVRWFATLDTSAGVSGLREGVVPDGRYWALGERGAQGYVDGFCGYSLELMPVLARIGRLARLRQEMVLGDVEGRDGALWLQEDAERKMLEEAEEIEMKIRSLEHCIAPEGTSENHEIGLAAEELQSTHRAFVHAALLHLHRRVQLLPKHHPKVREEVSHILDAVGSIHPSSTANILVLWPIFSAGCETDDLAERDAIQTRMHHMQTRGMGNYTRAREVMLAYWSSGAALRWDVYLQRSGLDLVLF
ncbi:uncharacterized protein P174DRAFT_155500 [Neofusicoccum parvum]|uniref:Uncharacterized protein P174DRAFT_155500 n=1 Tax=Neofusicoccum parvum TaxID=310453 RepID=A0ACB5RWJ4_9PEZI|nr:uncharacterized protein P174DRAFT_155500 [Neofusicoccum parvum]